MALDERRSEAMLAMTSSMPMVMFTFDRDGVSDWASGAGFERPGMEPVAAYVGRTLFEIYADFPENQAAVRRCLAGESIEAILRFHESIWDTRWQPILGDDGEVVGGRCLALDITHRVRAEAEARAATDRLAAIVEHVDDTVVLVDRAGVVLYASPAVERLTGLAPHQLVGYDIARFLPEQAYEQAQRLLDTVVVGPASPPPQELMLRHLDGHEVHVELQATDLRADPEVGAIAVTLRELTQRRITEAERRAHASRLEELNAELAVAVRVRDDLLSMSSHELRTPLTPIAGAVELLLTRGPEALGDDGRRLLESIDRNAKRMLRLVDDLLVMSGARAGVLHSRRTTVPLREVLDRALEDLGELARHVRVTGDLDVRVHVDVDHLDRIVTNLVVNADTYGAPPIELIATRTDGAVDLTVLDHGEGVPEAFVPRMWDRFAQADHGDARSSRGLGMGLPIVAELARLDDIELCYEGDGDGARFRLTLPLAPTDAAPG
jgi:PAS domain S-box-containing protein